MAEALWTVMSWAKTLCGTRGINVNLTLRIRGAGMEGVHDIRAERCSRKIAGQLNIKQKYGNLTSDTNWSFFLSFAFVSLVHFLCFMGKREIAALFVLQCWIKLTRFILFMLSCYATLASVIRDIGADLIVLINFSSCFSQLLELFDGWRGEISGKAMSDSIFSDFPLQQSRRH